MSLRNVRKIYGTTNPLPPLEGNSDEEFEPLYAKEKKINLTYEGLEVSSHSESEKEEQPEPTEEKACALAKPKKKKKNKKKNRQTKLEENAAQEGAIGHELDEIDKSVMEVNALLGAPPPASPSTPKKEDLNKKLLSVQCKHLDFNNELKKIFGSETLDESGRTKKSKPLPKYRRAAILPIPDNRIFHSVGLSMSLQRRENGLSYFTFDHNREYQKMHQYYISLLGLEDNFIPLDQARRNTHIEGMLESADFLFRVEEFSAANNLLESIISYLHYVAHPSFNLTNQSVRLEYKYLENRPFFITVLKYMHMLSNKACHRTALELGKLLLNLDPSDPLAIIYVVDVIALRAREHDWLVAIIDHWKTSRDAGYLFNIQYSYALAHFHIAKKNRSDYSHADELLTQALLMYPTVATRIFENCKHDASMTIRNHPFFDVAQDSKLPPKITAAITLHSKLVCWRWREPAVMDWFFSRAKEIVAKLDNDAEIKERARTLARHRQHVLAGCPDELQRHMHVVDAMSNLLADWELPGMVRQRAWDPLPPSNTINRYGYVYASVRPNLTID